MNRFAVVATLLALSLSACGEKAATSQAPAAPVAAPATTESAAPATPAAPATTESAAPAAADAKK